MIIITKSLSITKTSVNYLFTIVTNLLYSHIHHFHPLLTHLLHHLIQIALHHWYLHSTLAYHYCWYLHSLLASFSLLTFIFSVWLKIYKHLIILTKSLLAVTTIIFATMLSMRLMATEILHLLAKVYSEMDPLLYLNALIESGNLFHLRMWVWLSVELHNILSIQSKLRILEHELHNMDSYLYCCHKWI
jgi:hypothetical protein